MLTTLEGNWNPPMSLVQQFANVSLTMRSPSANKIYCNTPPEILRGQAWAHISRRDGARCGFRFFFFWTISILLMPLSIVYFKLLRQMHICVYQENKSTYTLYSLCNPLTLFGWSPCLENHVGTVSLFGFVEVLVFRWRSMHL